MSSKLMGFSLTKDQELDSGNHQIRSVLLFLAISVIADYRASVRLGAKTFPF
jgi:hypothetical protein